MERDNAALPSDAAPDSDFGGPGGMAHWQLTKSLAFACAYAHQGEPAFSQPCRTAESPLARTSARLGGYWRRTWLATWRGETVPHESTFAGPTGF
ncbi:MAG: hypothetical protein IJG13_02520 [Kiritimatiellae bacterium]|nr:hypothetical protein [Kiritimatiellia bacterium]MBQ3342217.1 hypothetical protein [Kiritimatiellia bacterium]